MPPSPTGYLPTNLQPHFSIGLISAVFFDVINCSNNNINIVGLP